MDTQPEYWQDRLAKLKACGFNTVETYVPWNLHEPKEGTFNFTGIADVQASIILSKEKANRISAGGLQDILQDVVVTGCCV